jgi:UDP-N-acetylglucosamine--N-acetylmuramyl-(pentapeptide) pyrophosphoryl-undecaprenol N-acetylglucosamine transferase
MKKIAFTGGGTGGHIYPGLAVIARLQEVFPCSVFWIGSDDGMDRSIVESAGIAFYGIPAGKLRRYFSLRNVFDIFKILAGFFTARKILKKEKPDLLFSKGGFVSVPPCMAAKSLGIPVFSHESDVSPGLATKINLRITNTIFTAYEETVSLLPEQYRAIAQAAGNPVRKDFFTASKDDTNAAKGKNFVGIKNNLPVVLVLGGSQGALEINELISGALDELTKSFNVIHQTGAGYNAAPRENYFPYQYFKDEMCDVLAAADIIVGRSGAGTVWESSALGKPMLLIPLCGSGTRGDQVENAQIFEKAGAAIVLNNEDRNSLTLTNIISSMWNDKEKYNAMKQASEAMGKKDAALFISEYIKMFFGIER